MKRRPVNLVVALPAEARPLRRHLGLARDDRVREWPLYRSHRITLLVCGVGMARAAAATRWLGGRQPDAAWLNLGIAGHPWRPLGEAVLVERITATGLAGGDWRLPLPATGLPADRLFTLEEPLPDYPFDGLCDMEGAGFYGAALELAPPPRILCLKLVSDNREQPADRISGPLVSDLVGRQLTVVDRLLAILEEVP